MEHLILSIIILGIAVSADSFAVGITYGIRKILSPLLSLLTISFCTGTAIFLSMTIGQSINRFISPELAQIFGGLLLIIIGSWALYNLFKSEYKTKKDSIRKGKSSSTPKRPEKKVELKNIKIIIEILRTPASADTDKSGGISIKESLVLGIALSLDAFGAGIGSAFLGYPVLLTTLVIALMSGSFVYLGTLTGQKIGNIPWVENTRFLPGIMLIIIGLMNLL